MPAHERPACPFKTRAQSVRCDGIVGARQHRLAGLTTTEDLVEQVEQSRHSFVEMPKDECDRARMRRLARVFLSYKREKWTLATGEVERVARECGFRLARAEPISRLFSGHKYAVLIRVGGAELARA